MFSYLLKFIDETTDCDSKPFHFKAPDASEALLIARTEAGHRDVELWKGSTKLCTLRAGTT
ncbi:hypothetical protein B2G71_05970 [Novosphingobium sp. PC22D]|uniref:hypothetical protein n=1 Tax=Novosphingobium sp. PC22D TaxID=1962403 RepID=UPI000BF16D35|nr:hypothetical protein [Novosphingobium sp. PC22D]PEQ13850.1 hypothetical protein B2G71_05970 [Novosphingobium sp. PC22D]